MLVAGGSPDGIIAFNEAELYDPALKVWTVAAPMVTRRSLHTATRLSSGRVLVVGGWNEVDAEGSAELYDPSTGVWLPAGTLGERRSQHTATLLADDTVLVAGGALTDLNAYIAGAYPYIGVTSCERYIEALNSWSSTGSLAVPRASHSADLLSGGKVLVAGGYDITPPSPIGSTKSSAELYDPATGAWSSTGSMASARWFHGSAQLPNDRILVAGGGTDTVPQATAEVYTPSSGTWSSTASMSTARGAFTLIKLPGTSSVLAAGGGDGTSQVASAELYSPGAGTWASTVSLNVARSDHGASVVGGGVLVSGGFGSSPLGQVPLADAEIYVP